MKIVNFKIFVAHTNELGDVFEAYRDKDNHLMSVCDKEDASAYINRYVSGIVVFPDDKFVALNLTPLE